jgi:hypothetical protein
VTALPQSAPAHGLHVPMKAAWYPALAQELLSFPVSKTDDQVDALSSIGQMLDVIVPPKLASNVVCFPPLPKDYIVARELERSDEAANWTFKWAHGVVYPSSPAVRPFRKENRLSNATSPSSGETSSASEAPLSQRLGRRLLRYGIVLLP